LGLACPGALQASLAAGEAETVVQGRVVDARTGSPIDGARVAAGGRETATRVDGSFSLSLPPGAVSLSVTARGFTPASLPVSPGNGVEVVVSLSAVVRFQEQVEVAAPAGPETPSSLPVRPVQVLEAAGAADNVFRVLQALPGVSATQEFSSRISVRGGGPDENLTVMDGVEISNPYRLQGLVSAFNPETVLSFALDTGAFGVAHGDRLSSLLVVQNRAGTDARALAGSAGLSLTDGNAIVEGKLPGEGKGSWILSGRRTYYDLVANHIVGTDLPAFGDLQAKLVLLPHPGTRLSLSGLRSRESADASFDGDTPGDHGEFLDAARNDLLAATLEADLGPRGTSRTIASWYRNTESFDLSARFQDKSLRSNAPDDSGFGQANVAFTRDLTVRDLAVREELGFRVSDRHRLEAGAETHRLTTRVSWHITGDRNEAASNESSVQGGTGLPSVLDSSVDSGRSGAWLQDRVEIGHRFVLETGLRFDYSEVNRKADLSPRVAATLRLGQGTSMRWALGGYTQSPGYDKLVQADYFVDLSQAGALGLPNERSWHGSWALERDVARGVTVRAEAYYKSFRDLTIGRLETDAERDTRLAQYDFPADLQSSIPSSPQITTDPVGVGRGRAFGFDLYAARRATSADTRLTGWASYTYGVADREAYGRTYPFDYDRRHALSIVDRFRVKDWFEVATTLRVASGFPTTPVVGLRVAAVADGSTLALVPRRDPAGRLVYTPDRGTVSNLNSARLPVFARLDVRATFAPHGRTGRWLFYLDAINVLNRKNAGSIDTTLAYDPTSDRPRPVEDRGGSIPFLPSFGVRFRF
jgi:hypothetical protein